LWHSPPEGLWHEFVRHEGLQLGDGGTATRASRSRVIDQRRTPAMLRYALVCSYPAPSSSSSGQCPRGAREGGRAASGITRIVPQKLCPHWVVSARDSDRRQMAHSGSSSASPILRAVGEHGVLAAHGGLRKKGLAMRSPAMRSNDGRGEGGRESCSQQSVQLQARWRRVTRVGCLHEGAG